MNWDGRGGDRGGRDGSLSSVLLRTPATVPPFWRLPAGYSSPTALAFSVPCIEFSGCRGHTKQNRDVPRPANKLTLLALFPEGITVSLLRGREVGWRWMRRCSTEAVLPAHHLPPKGYWQLCHCYKTAFCCRKFSVHLCAGGP